MNLESFKISVSTEILISIFEYLSLRDLKNIRLTCKLWSEISKTNLFSKKEKFVIRGGYGGIRKFIHILSTSSYSRINLEIECFNLQPAPKDVWKDCGHKIHTISLYHCPLGGRTMKQIFLHCLNLESFKISVVRSSLLNNVISKTLESFIKRGIKRYLLKTFSIQSTYEHYEYLPCWRNIFEVFPNINHCGSFLGVSTVESMESFNVNSSVEFESLNFSSGSVDFDDNGWNCFDKDQVLLLWTRRLKKFKTNFDGDWTEKSKLSYFRFFAEQRDLEVIDLGFFMYPVCLKSLLFHILECCPKLREFSCTFQLKLEKRLLKLSCEEAVKFINSISNLRVLDCEIVIETSPVLPFFTTSLRSLTLRNRIQNDNFNAFILNHSKKLMHLRLYGSITDHMLQLIFMTQPQLRTLKLCGGRKSAVTSNGIAGDGSGETFSIRRLQKLEYLEINGLRGQFIEAVMSELQFPRLKTLKLVNLNLPHGPLANRFEMFAAMPQLQYCELGTLINNVDECVELMKHAKNLEFLCLGYDSPVILCVSPKWKRIFEENLNLKCVIQPPNFLKRNPFTKALIYSRHDHLKPPDVEPNY